MIRAGSLWLALHLVGCSVGAATPMLQPVGPTINEVVYGAGEDGRLVVKRSPLSRAYPYKDGVRLGYPPRGWSADRWYRYDPWIVEAAHKYGVDEAEVKALLQAESGFNPTARSRAGAEGIGQLMPETARRLGVRNPNDPHECIWGTCAYLRRTTDFYHSLNMAVHAGSYNAGEDGVYYHLLRVLGIPFRRGAHPVPPRVVLEMVNQRYANLALVVPENKETPNYVHNYLWNWDRIHQGRV